MLRKIETVEEKAKREKRRNKILIGLMLLILLGSTAGYAFLNGDKQSNGQAKINGVQNVGNQWAANFNGNTLYFTSSPDDAKNVSTGDLSQEEYLDSKSCPQSLSVSAAGCGNSETESCLVYGHHLYPFTKRICVPGCHY